MKIIKLYEEFTNKTLSINNLEYNRYFDRYKDTDRSGIVAWVTPGSQEKNFNLVSKCINSDDSLLDYGCGVGDFIKYLNNKNINIKDYLGVDINDNFIKHAKETYPENEFKHIDNINQINGKWDNICAIGVFTWFITKEEFIETIYKLYDMCNKQVILTVLGDDGDINTPYGYSDYDEEEEDIYWNEEYRYYDENLFYNLFPDLNITFKYNDGTMLVIIKK